MGFVRMRRNFGHHMRTIMWLILVVFVIGTFFLWGLTTTGREGRGRGAETGPAQDVLAVVNGEKITRDQYEAIFQRTYDQYQQMGMASLAGLEVLRWQALDGLIQHRLMVQAAKQQGVRVSDREVENQIQAQLQQVPEGGDREYRSRMEASLRANTEQIRDDMLTRKLQEAVLTPIKVSDQDLRDSYREVRARHILIRVDPGGKEGLSDAAARQKAEQILAKLKGGADFAALAKQSSDDKATAVNAGDLGFFPRGRMVPEFDQAAFSLKPGQLSGIVRTNFGYHIIKVEGERSALPADFDKKIAQYRQQYLTQQRGRVSQAFMQRIRQEAKIEVRDPEMRGALALADGRSAEALAEFTKAKERASKLGDQAHAAIYLSLGDLYGAKGDWKTARNMYSNAENVASSSLQDVYLALGRANLKLGSKADAINWYKKAEAEAPDDYRVHQELLKVYQGLGDKEAVARQQKWIDEQQRKFAEEQRKRTEEAARAQAAAARKQAGTAAPEAGKVPEPGKVLQKQPAGTSRPTQIPVPAGR